MALYGEKYADYGPTLAAECMAAEDGVSVAVATLRGWLLAAGLRQRERRRQVHRRRRPRKEQFGEMVQMDGSHHDWFEVRRCRVRGAGRIGRLRSGLAPLVLDSAARFGSALNP
ncbi:MAG: hypothetical protein GYA33_10140 [Thermogutta sp.]|nr:hypothetical protein [Thermogutta sp.]